MVIIFKKICDGNEREQHIGRIFISKNYMILKKNIYAYINVQYLLL